MAPKPPPALVQYLQEKRCVLFCGSGLSAWANFPTWETLLLQLIGQTVGETVNDQPDLEAELRRLLKTGKLLEVADYCKESLGQRYNEFLFKTLSNTIHAIPAPHKIIVKLPFAGIVTTNYDKLIRVSLCCGHWEYTSHSHT